MLDEKCWCECPNGSRRKAVWKIMEVKSSECSTFSRANMIPYMALMVSLKTEPLLCACGKSLLFYNLHSIWFTNLRYSVAFVFLASAVTSEDCIQGAKCAGPRVRAAEYTNLRKHRQWIANDTQNKTRKKTFTQKTTKELYRHWIGFLYTLILLNCVW